MTDKLFEGAVIDGKEFRLEMAAYYSQGTTKLSNSI